MFKRRVAKGQCFHRPYLGIREFACHFAVPDKHDTPIDWTEPLGFMLYDMKFDSSGTNQPGFFDAKVSRGVLHCDSEDSSQEGEPPVHIHW
jgi:CRISPR-associated protein Cas5d